MHTLYMGAPLYTASPSQLHEGAESIVDTGSYRMLCSDKIDVVQVNFDRHRTPDQMYG